jgi:hypothetical protein
MAVAVAIFGVLTNGSSASVGSGLADATMGEIIVDGTLTLSGNYGAGAGTHGDALSFAVSSSLIFGSNAPTKVEIYEAPLFGVAPLGYQYQYAYGPTLAAPTQAGGALQVFGTGAASGQGGTELTNGSAYSTFTPSLNGAVLRFRAWFAKQ